MVEKLPVRWGILATGGIATEFVEDLMLLPDDAEVLAVGSRTQPAADAFAAEHAIPRAYGSWAELAADPDVDVVYVATPHAAHHAATMLCLRAGKPVLCEKPLTLDLPTSRELVDTAAQAGLFLMEAMWMRVNPAIRRMVELVRDGAIGEVTHVYADFGVAGPFPAGHRMRAKELGGGALLDLGVYPMTFAQLFLGPPQQITAVATLHPEGTDANTAIALGYPSGAVATLHCGMTGETDQRAVVTGTAGRIEVPRQFYKPRGFTLVRSGTAETVEFDIRGNGLGYEAEEVHRCLRQGEKDSPFVPLAQTLQVMDAMDDIRRIIGVSYD